MEAHVAKRMTVDQVPGTLPVLADQNPRCTFGQNTLKQYSQLKDWKGDDLPVELRRNSMNHKNKGQNVGRWDGSVKWITDANSPTNPEDDIYVLFGNQRRDRRAPKRHG